MEGHGEVKALPILVRRVAEEGDWGLAVKVDPVFRVPASRLRQQGGLERYVENAARKMAARGGILILMDCDWENGCPKSDAPALLDRARRVRSNVPISVVLAYREYEAWFIAAAESLAGRRGLKENLSSDRHPEGIRGAKEWLSARMPRTQPYSETTDQPALTALFDMKRARRADSFDKCYREIEGMLRILAEQEAECETGRSNA